MHYQAIQSVPRVCLGGMIKCYLAMIASFFSIAFISMGVLQKNSQIGEY